MRATARIEGSAAGLPCVIGFVSVRLSGCGRACTAVCAEVSELGQAGAGDECLLFGLTGARACVREMMNGFLVYG